MCLVQRTVFSCMVSHPAHLYLHGTIPPVNPCNNVPPDTMHCRDAFFVDKRIGYKCRQCSEHGDDFLVKLDARIPADREPKESDREALKGMLDDEDED